MNRITRRYRAPLLATLALAAALAVSACGGDDDDDTAASEEAASAFAGPVEGSDAFVGIVADEDGAVRAYLCDGKRTSEWFEGELDDDGQIALDSKGGARLEASVGDRARGTVTADGETFSFTAAPAEGPGGLYRAEGETDTLSYLAGWIVLADGRQRGAFELEPREGVEIPEVAGANDLGNLVAVQEEGAGNVEVAQAIANLNCNGNCRLPADPRAIVSGSADPETIVCNECQEPVVLCPVGERGPVQAGCQDPPPSVAAGLATLVTCESFGFHPRVCRKKNSVCSASYVRGSQKWQDCIRATR